MKDWKKSQGDSGVFLQFAPSLVIYKQTAKRFPWIYKQT